MLLVATAGLVRGYRSVPVPGGRLFVGRQSSLIDITTIVDVWEGAMFPARCAGRVVVDVGAHKGYFSSWALSHGATAVLSYEPQSENVTALQLGHDSHDAASSWLVQAAAVGAESGRATLYLSGESWGHSLHRHMADTVRSEQVDVVTLESALSRADALRPGAEVVLKLNVEGAAGDILFAAPPEALTSVVEVHLDHEPGSPHSADSILQHLADAGLSDVQVHLGRLYRITRPLQAR